MGEKPKKWVFGECNWHAKNKLKTEEKMMENIFWHPQGLTDYNAGGNWLIKYIGEIIMKQNGGIWFCWGGKIN